MLADEPKKAANLDPESQDLGTGNEGPEPEETRSGNWRQAFRVALDKARQQQKPTVSRQELGRDKSKSLFLLGGVGVAILLLFFGVFSHPKTSAPLPGENPHGQ